MTDREKQIEEIAKDICKSYEKCKPCNCLDCVKRSVFEKAISKGYRKLPEDSVVLTKGAYESISSKAKANVVNAVEIRKETAREILGLYSLSDTFSSFQEKVAKQFDIEIKK